MPFDPGVGSLPGFGEPYADPLVYQDYNPNYPTGPIIQLSRTPRQARVTSCFFTGPTVVALPSNFTVGPAIQLSRFPRQARFAHAQFRAPTVVGAVVVTFLPAPLRIALAKPRLSRQALSKVRPPAVVAPAYLPQASRVTLAKPGAFKPPTRFTVRKPTIVGSAVTFPGIRVTLARTPAVARRSRYTVKPPTVLGTAAISSFPVGLNIQLVRAPRQALRTKSTVRPPSILGAVPTANFPVGLQISLARTRPEYRPLLGLTWVAPPTIVQAAAPIQPLRVTLAPQVPRALRRTCSTYRPPIVVLPPTPTSFTVGPIIQLARTPRAARKVTYTGRFPAVVATPTLTRAQLTLRVTLARRQWAVQPTQTRIFAPTIVEPFVPPPPVTVQSQQDMTPFIVHGF